MAEVTGDGAVLATELRAALARYPYVRGRRARVALVSQEAAEALSDVLDDQTGDEDAAWRVQGVPVVPAPVMTSTAAGDADVLVLSAGDLFVWEAPLLTFRWDERHGPDQIDLALYGYFACRLLRATGLAAIRYTAG